MEERTHDKDMPVHKLRVTKFFLPDSLCEKASFVVNKK